MEETRSAEHETLTQAVDLDKRYDLKLSWSIQILVRLEAHGRQSHQVW